MSASLKVNPQDRYWLGILLAVATSLTASLGQLALKFSAAHIDFAHPLTIVLNAPFLLGILINLVSFFLIITAYRYGELTVLFPVGNLTYVWNIALAVSFLGEVLTPMRVAGTLLIVLGAVFITR